MKIDWQNHRILKIHHHNFPYRTWLFLRFVKLCSKNHNIHFYRVPVHILYFACVEESSWWQIFSILQSNSAKFIHTSIRMNFSLLMVQFIDFFSSFIFELCWYRWYRKNILYTTYCDFKAFKALNMGMYQTK